MQDPFGEERGAPVVSSCDRGHGQNLRRAQDLRCTRLPPRPDFRWTVERVNVHLALDTGDKPGPGVLAEPPGRSLVDIAWVPCGRAHPEFGLGQTLDIIAVIEIHRGANYRSATALLHYWVYRHKRIESYIGIEHVFLSLGLCGTPAQSKLLSEVIAQQA